MFSCNLIYNSTLLSIFFVSCDYFYHFLCPSEWVIFWQNIYFFVFKLFFIYVIFCNIAIYNMLINKLLKDTMNDFIDLNTMSYFPSCLAYKLVANLGLWIDTSCNLHIRTGGRIVILSCCVLVWYAGTRSYVYKILDPTKTGRHDTWSHSMMECLLN